MALVIPSRRPSPPVSEEVSRGESTFSVGSLWTWTFKSDIVEVADVYLVISADGSCVEMLTHRGTIESFDHDWILRDARWRRLG